MKRFVFLLVCIGIVALLPGCMGILSSLFGSTVSLSLSCPEEYVDGVGTDRDWRVALDDGDRMTLSSASGGSLEFEKVEKGSHTLWFTPPSGCYDQVVASYTFDVDGDTDLSLSVYELTPLSNSATRFSSRTKEQ